MSPEDMAHFREVLLDRSDRLNEVNRSLNAGRSQDGQDTGRMSIDFGENASAAHDADFSIACIENLEEELLQIGEALGRIEVGAYGVCDHCESPIPRRRLDHLPFATLCIGCKQLEERGEI